MSAGCPPLNSWPRRWLHGTILVSPLCRGVPPLTLPLRRLEATHQHLLVLWHQLHLDMRSLLSWQYLIRDIQQIQSWSHLTVSRPPVPAWDSTQPRRFPPGSHSSGGS